MSIMDGGSNLIAAEIHYLLPIRELQIVDTNALPKPRQVGNANPSKGQLISKANSSLFT